MSSDIKDSISNIIQSCFNDYEVMCNTYNNWCLDRASKLFTEEDEEGSISGIPVVEVKNLLDRMVSPKNESDKIRALRWRHKFSLGGTASAILLGVNKYKTPLDLYTEMTSNSLGGDSSNFLMKAGIAMEETIGREAASLLHAHWREGDTRICSDMIWSSCQIDSYLSKPSDHELRVPLEIKLSLGTSSEEWGKGCEINDSGEIVAEDDLIPPMYMIQCQKQLMITKNDFMYLAAWLTFSKEIRIYKINASLELMARIAKADTDFMFNNLITGTQPEGGRPTNEITEALQSGREVKLSTEQAASPDRVKELCQEYSKISSEIKHLNQELSAIKESIQGYFGESVEAITDDYGNLLCTYKYQKRKSLNSDYIKNKYPFVYRDTNSWKTTVSRVLLPKS